MPETHSRLERNPSRTDVQDSLVVGTKQAHRTFVLSRQGAICVECLLRTLCSCSSARRPALYLEHIMQGPSSSSFKRTSSAKLRPYGPPAVRISSLVEFAGFSEWEQSTAMPNICKLGLVCMLQTEGLSSTKLRMTGKAIRLAALDQHYS